MEIITLPPPPPDAEPAHILETVDCGSGHHFGIRPVCKRAHGHRIRIARPSSLKTEN